MITLTGTLQTITGGATTQGYVAVMLCGFGGQVPTIPGSAVLAEISPAPVAANANGAVSLTLYGNDKIAPAGTYYTLTVMDSNEDIVQVNAYQIVGSDRSLDISSLLPFDPTGLPAPPLPIPIASRIVAMVWTPAPVFLGGAGLTFELAQMQGDTLLSFTGGVPGNLYVFITTQAGDVPRNLTYGAMIHGGSPANPQLNGRLVQAFVCRSDLSLDSIGGGIYL